MRQNNQIKLLFSAQLLATNGSTEIEIINEQTSPKANIPAHIADLMTSKAFC